MIKKRAGTKKPASKPPARRDKPARSAKSNRPGLTGRPTPQLRSAPVSSRASSSQRSHQQSKDVAKAAIEAALDKKALMPVLLDVSDRASYTDFIGVVSGRSDRQVEAIAQHVREALQHLGLRLLGREGSGNGRWTLLDFGEVVMHIFYHPVRELYDIEGLWIDAPRVPLKIPPEAQLYQPDALYAL